MTASRWTPPRCRSSTPPGSAARTAGPARATTWPPGSAATPRTPDGFYGFRLAVKTDLGSRVIRAWSIVPAAVNEREVAGDVLQARPPPRDPLCDKGFTGVSFAAAQAARARGARPARPEPAHGHAASC